MNTRWFQTRWIREIILGLNSCENIILNKVGLVQEIKGWDEQEMVPYMMDSGDSRLAFM